MKQLLRHPSSDLGHARNGWCSSNESSSSWLHTQTLASLLKPALSTLNARKECAPSIMGSISSLDSLDQHDRRNRGVNGFGRNHGEVNGFAPFEVDGLASDQKTSESGMKDEVVLLSWLIVLLRTREGECVSFDWAYSDFADISTSEPVTRHLSMNEVVTDLQNSVAHCTATIAGHLKKFQSRQDERRPGPSSVVLSTNSLSRQPSEVQNEVGRACLR